MQKRRAAQTMGLQALGVVLSSVSLGGCAYVHGARSKNVDVSVSAMKQDAIGEDDGASTVMAMEPEATPTQTASPEDIAQANAALGRGVAAYHRGDYAQAEQAFKEALVFNPFLAPAHLALGKIYLLRGIAADDHRRLTKGRRMVEMALKLDPKLAGAAVYLALFP